MKPEKRMTRGTKSQEIDPQEVGGRSNTGQSHRPLREITPVAEARDHSPRNYAEHLRDYDWTKASKDDVFGPSDDPETDAQNKLFAAAIDYHHPDNYAKENDPIKSLANSFVDLGKEYLQEKSQKKKDKIEWPKVTENQRKAMTAEFESRVKKSPGDPEKITREMLTLMIEKTAEAST